MSKIKFIISICIFSILLGITSIIKTQTRIIEKNIHKIDGKIAFIEKDLHETQLDYFYLSSPDKLSKKIKELSFIEYVPIDFSRIYLNYRDFTNSQKKITTLKININNEEKTKKK
tara:strand:+ start:157 stop:501 length:345 start_codon:yes stop_codon:yes gene_type:complete